MHQNFIQKLQAEFKNPLPGRLAHSKMKPYLSLTKNIQEPPPINPKLSAVMAVIFPKNNIPHLLLMERTKYEGVHSGQISLPGGKIENEDNSPLNAALRETYEEVGINPKQLNIIGKLTDVYVLASNFLIYPYVAYLDEKPNLILEKKEVEQVLEIPILHFLDTTIIKEKKIQSYVGITLNAPYYDVHNKTLWGATAMIVSELTEIIKKINY